MNCDRPFQHRRLVLVILILVVASLFLGSCARDPSATFRNPSFRCPSREVVESSRGYPFPQSKDGVKSVKDLKAFCKRMSERFDESNLTVGEADRFYALLRANNETVLPGGQFLFFSNGTYAMPGPEAPEPFVFEKQVKLKKLSDDRYEIFYYHIDCGRNYSHMEFYLQDGALVDYEYLDSWGESFPC